jgi:hypothetical protein
MKRLAFILIAITIVVACSVGGTSTQQFSTDISTVYHQYPQPIPLVPVQFESISQLCHARTGINGKRFYFLVGTVISNPNYVPGIMQKNIELSHTYFNVLPLAENNPNNYYIVAANNVFATGYDKSQAYKQVPQPLTNLGAGTQVALCGITYADNGKFPYGIDWVHIYDVSGMQGGWLKQLYADGTLSDNLESNVEYLHLWSDTYLLSN